jgi:uncharacterized membrane protein YfcA
MESLLEILNLTPTELAGLIILGLVLIGGWFALRLTMRLAGNVFRIGCGIIILIMLAVFLLSYNL